MPKFPSNTCGSYITKGNLPTYKTKECVSSVVTSSNLSQIKSYFPWIGIEDFHYFHIKCPFSIQSKMHYVKDTDLGSSTYFMTVDVGESLTDHTLTSGLMVRHSRGSNHGWLCVDPNCPYYGGTASGTTLSGTKVFTTAGNPYFYI